MTSDAESTHDQTIMDLTATPCAICGPSTRDEVMVGCDGCSEWFHIRCVGIEKDNLPKKWYCQSKACQETAQEYRQKQKDAKKQPRTRKNGNESDISSVSSRLAASSVEAKGRALEEKQKQQYEELEVEMLLRKKEMAMQRAFEQRKMELELQMRAEEEVKQRAWQAEMLQKKKEQLQRLKANRESSFEIQMAAMDEELAELSGRKSKPAPKVVTDVSRAIPSGKINPNVLKLSKEKERKQTRGYDSTDEEDEDDYSDDSDLQSQSSVSSMERKTTRKMRNKVGSLSQNGLGQQQTRPTKAQLAARMGLTYKLPKFSGKPAQWPLFYAAYKVSNDVCGYMNHENLMRLQEALEGDALELVSGQLLLPESIPQVIEKLRRHFGRPEQLLQCLLDKVNRLEPPRPDNLRSFVPFGNTVEQLCGHLEAADLRQHLVNPLLIKSLVAKLPDREKREWVHYRRGRGETTLRTLTDFLMDIVADACEANVDVDFVEFNPPPPSEADSQSEEEGSDEAGPNPLMHPVGNTVGLSAHIRTNCTVLFRIVPVQLHYGGKTVSVLAFLDEGASVTLVEKKLADRLGAVGVQERLTIQWTGNTSREKDSRRMSLWASGTGAAAGGKMLLHTVHTADKLMLPHQKLDLEELAAQYEHMRGLPIESYDGQPQLLIGVNNIHAFAPIEAKVGTPVEPIAVRTKLGWTVYGPRQETSATADNYLGYHRQITNVGLPPELFKSNHALEELVVAIPRGTAKKKRSQEIRERTTQLVGDRCTTGLLSKARGQKVKTFPKPDSHRRTTTNMVPNARRQVEQQNRWVRIPKRDDQLAGSSTEPRRGEAGDTGALELCHPADGKGESLGSDQESKWRPAFSTWFLTRHRSELLPQLDEEKRPSRRLVANGTSPGEVTIDLQKKKCWAIRAPDKGRKLSDEVQATTSRSGWHDRNRSTVVDIPSDGQPAVEMVRRSATSSRGRLVFVVEGKNHRSWTCLTSQREDTDGKVLRRGVIKVAALKGKVNPGMQDITG
ncbi:uncharacterized protein LOC134287427 [Aedes albopictus]|uniref:PHD-type domain-containing protein n=1 Tax=Aedes albopictus TaxID=7160 RepID=A0ABM1Y2F4_AEDAL